MFKIKEVLKIHDIIKIANEIANSTNNATNFTNIQSNLPKTEHQIKDEVIEMIYQKHLQAQEWGNKLNQELETNTHKHENNRNRIKRDFLGIGNWIENAAKDTVNAVGTAGKATGNWIAGAARDTGNWLSENAPRNGLRTIDDHPSKQIWIKCINDKGVLVDMAVYGGIGVVESRSNNWCGLHGALIEGAAGVVAPCASVIIKDELNIRDKRYVNFDNININNEQNFPIGSKTNFVTSNITSL